MDQEPTRIVRLAAENLKRLRVVEIEPDGNLVVISGRNGQGKTSILDAIAFALGGGALMKQTTKPIRDGEDHAKVTLDMGDYTVTRTWDEAGSRVIVMAKDGSRYPSPQKFLDERLGDLSFDPLGFTRKGAKDQVADLLQLVKLPFDPLALEAERDMVFGRRTSVGRDLKSLQGQLDAVVDAPPGDDEQEENVGELLVQARAADAEHTAFRELVQSNERLQERQNELDAEMDRLKRQLAVAAQAQAANKEMIASKEAAIQATAEAGLPDLDSLQGRLGSVELENAAVRERNRQRAAKRDLEHEISIIVTTHTSLTAEIEAIDKRKADALAAAEMPVDGLAFDKEGVTYRGMPFPQCSAAEQLRVSLGMAMAMNPTIGVIRITDGSLLDKGSMEMIREMAEERHMQVWVERVADEKGIGFVIEDGAVA